MWAKKLKIPDSISVKRISTSTSVDPVRGAGNVAYMCAYVRLSPHHHHLGLTADSIASKCDSSELAVEYSSARTETW